MNLPDFSVKKPVTITMLILIGVVLGVISLSRMGLDLMPDITFPMLTIVTPYEGVGPEEVEKLITLTIEKTAAMVRGVKNISSFSREGFSAVMVEFEWGTNMDYAAQEIRDKIDLMSMILPEDAGDPQVIKFDTGLMPVGGWGVTGELDLRELLRIAENEIEIPIQQIDGVSAVYLYGGLKREIRVELNKNKLDAYRISPQMVSQSISMDNINVSGGRLREDYHELTLRVTGEFKSIKDIEETLVTMRGGAPIFVSDIADVVDTHKEVRSLARINGKLGVLLIMFKEPGANTVAVSSRVKKRMKEIEKGLPSQIKTYCFLDQGHMIKRILKVTLSTALWGGMLAVGVLFFFLRSWRPTVIIATAIPLSLLVTFIPLYAAGFTINFVILIGFALGVGMIVDNAIVVIENTYRQISITGDSYIASSVGAKQVGMAISASTFTTVAVFIPLFFAGGVVGKIFSQLAITIVAALIFSLIVALSIIPMMSSRLLSIDGGSQKSRWMDGMRNRYTKLLSRLLKNKKKIGGGILIAIVISIAVFPFIGKEYFPSIDSSMLIMSIEREAGALLKETDRIVKRVEELFAKEPDVDVYAGFIGVMEEGGEIDAAMGTGPAGPHEASVFVRLKDKKNRKISAADIKNNVRRGLPPLEGVKYEFQDMGGAMMAGGSGDYPVQIKIFGMDIVTLKNISEKIKEKISGIPGIYDAGTSLEEGNPQYSINIDRRKASSFGLSVSRIGSTVKSSVKGKISGVFREKGEEYDIKVILKEDYRTNIRDIKNISLLTNGGGLINLSQVAEIELAAGPAVLERENKRRRVVVYSNYSEGDFSGVMKEVRNVVGDIFMPAGYYVEYGGEAENVREMLTTLIQLFALAILLIYMVMAAQFESFIQPLIIMVTLPLAWIGVMWILIITGRNISMPAAMGVLILFGIVVNNAIVLIDCINQLRKDEGMGLREAVLEGAKIRMRPILMTASTTIIAMIPMALSSAEGSAVRSVVAISIIGGLMVGTILTLFVIPMVYDFVEKRISRRVPLS